jgi:hypothetical protein
LKNPITKKLGWRSGSIFEGPEFKPQYWGKKKKKRPTLVISPKDTE